MNAILSRHLFVLPIMLLVISCLSFSQGNWVQQQSGTTRTLYAVYFLDLSHGWAAGDSGTVIKTTDGGTSWSPISPPGPYLLRTLSFFNDSIGWTAGNSMLNGELRMFRTTDGGNSWDDVTPATDTVNAILAFHFFSQDSGLAGGLGNVGLVLKTTDRGESWQRQSSPLTFAVRDFYFFDNNVGWLSGGRRDLPGVVSKTTDGGATWDSARVVGYEPFYTIFFLDQSRGWTAGGDPEFGGTLARTTDGGATWQGIPISDTVNNVQFQVHKIYFADTSRGWLVSVYGIYGTTNGGMTWHTEAQYSRSSVVTLTDGCFVGNTGWAVGSGGLILKNENLVPVRELSAKQPTSFAVEAAYPNPFNGQTVIRYSLKNSSKVILKIYDILGREVRTLDEGFVEPGFHMVRVEAGELASGLYLFRMTAGENIHVGKLLLMK